VHNLHHIILYRTCSTCCIIFCLKFSFKKFTLLVGKVSTAQNTTSCYSWSCIVLMGFNAVFFSHIPKRAGISLPYRNYIAYLLHLCWNLSPLQKLYCLPTILLTYCICAGISLPYRNYIAYLLHLSALFLSQIWPVACNFVEGAVV